MLLRAREFFIGWPSLCVFTGRPLLSIFFCENEPPSLLTGEVSQADQDSFYNNKFHLILTAAAINFHPQ